MLVRASEVIHRPVVTMKGEDLAQIKDVVYSAGGGEVGGFTLAGRGAFAGPLKSALPWSSVAALGPDAVMINDEGVLTPTGEVLEGSTATSGPGSNVLGAEVLTDDGAALGSVADVILGLTDAQPPVCDVVGYEVASHDPQGNAVRFFVPLPDTLSVSGEHLIVPRAARDFIAQDLPGLDAATKSFRNTLTGGH